MSSRSIAAGILVAGAGLWVHAGLVWLTTLLAVLAYGTLVADACLHATCAMNAPTPAPASAIPTK